MSESTSGSVASPAGPLGPLQPHCQWCHLGHWQAECPYLLQRDRLGRALFLEELLADLATLRSVATVTYAETFLGAQGTDAQRTQAAKAGAADDHLAAELAAAKVAAYRYLIEGTDDE